MNVNNKNNLTNKQGKFINNFLVPEIYFKSLCATEKPCNLTETVYCKISCFLLKISFARGYTKIDLNKKYNLKIT